MLFVLVAAAAGAGVLGAGAAGAQGGPASEARCAGGAQQACVGDVLDDPLAGAGLQLLQLNSKSKPHQHQAQREEVAQAYPPVPEIDLSKPLTLVTFETRGAPLFTKDKRFAKGFPVQVVNMGEHTTFVNYLQKIDMLVHFLRGATERAKAKGKEHVRKVEEQFIVYADGGDIIWGGCDPARFVASYREIAKRSGAPIVFGAEMKCGETDCRKVPAVPPWAEEMAGSRRLSNGFWADLAWCPDGTWNDECAKNKFCFGCNDPLALQYLNAGFFAGPAKDMLAMAEEAKAHAKDWACPICFWMGDQGVFAHYWLANPDKVTLDYGTDLVVNLNGLVIDDMVSVGSDGKVQNKAFGREQCFVHGNGWRGEKEKVRELQEAMAQGASPKAAP